MGWKTYYEFTAQTCDRGTSTCSLPWFNEFHVLVMLSQKISESLKCFQGIDKFKGKYFKLIQFDTAVVSAMCLSEVLGIKD
jgi:hypothetical protein